MRWVAQQLAAHWLAHLRTGDEQAAQRLAHLHVQTGPARGGWWRSLLTAVLAPGALYPIRTAAAFGVGLLLRIVLGYATANIINRINLWITPSVPLSWLDLHVNWTWALVAWGVSSCLIGWVVSIVDREIAIATVAGLILFFAVLGVVDIAGAVFGRHALAVITSRLLSLSSESLGLLVGLHLSTALPRHPNQKPTRLTGS